MWVIYFNGVACFWLLCGELYRVGKHNCHVTIQNDKSISRTHLTIEVDELPTSSNLLEFPCEIHATEEADIPQRESIAGERNNANECEHEISCNAYGRINFRKEHEIVDCIPTITLTDLSTYGTIVYPSTKCEYNIREKNWEELMPYDLNKSKVISHNENTSSGVTKRVMITNSISATASTSNMYDDNNDIIITTITSNETYAPAQNVSNNQKVCSFITDHNLHQNGWEDKNVDFDNDDAKMQRELSSIEQWNLLHASNAKQATVVHSSSLSAAVETTTSNKPNVEEKDYNQEMKASNICSDCSIKQKLINSKPFVVPCNEDYRWQEFTINMGKHNAELTLVWVKTHVLVEKIDNEVASKFRHAVNKCGAQIHLPLSPLSAKQSRLTKIEKETITHVVLKQIEVIEKTDYYCTSLLEPSSLAIALLCRNTPIVQPSFFIAIRDRHSPQQELPNVIYHTPQVSSAWNKYVSLSREEMINNINAERELKKFTSHEWENVVEENRCNECQQENEQKLAALIFGRNSADLPMQREKLFESVTFVSVQLLLFWEVAQYIPFTGAHIIYDEAIESTFHTIQETTMINTEHNITILIDILEAVYAKLSLSTILVYRADDTSENMSLCINCLCNVLHIPHIEESQLITQILLSEPMHAMQNINKNRRMEADSSVHSNISEFVKRYVTANSSYPMSTEQTSNVQNALCKDVNLTSTESERIAVNTTSTTKERYSDGGGNNDDDDENRRKTHAAPLFPEFEEHTGMLYKSSCTTGNENLEYNNHCRRDGNYAQYIKCNYSERHSKIEWVSHSPVDVAEDGACVQRRCVDDAGWISWHLDHEDNEQKREQTVINTLCNSSELTEPTSNIVPMPICTSSIQKYDNLPFLPPYPCFLSYLQREHKTSESRTCLRGPKRFEKQKWIASNEIVEVIRDGIVDINNTNSKLDYNTYTTGLLLSSSSSSSSLLRNTHNANLNQIPSVDADNIISNLQNHSVNYSFINAVNMFDEYNSAYNKIDDCTCDNGINNARNEQLECYHNDNNNSLAASFNAFDVATHHSMTKSRKRAQRTGQRTNRANNKPESNTKEKKSHIHNTAQIAPKAKKLRTERTTVDHNSNSNSNLCTSNTDNRLCNRSNNINKNDSNQVTSNRDYNNDDLFELFGI